MDIQTIINDIIGFIESFLQQLEAFFASIVKTNGWDDPANYPDNFPKAE